MERFFFTLSLWLACLLGLFAHAPSQWPLELQVRVDGRCRPVYSQDGRFYIEALKGREYSLLLVNHSDRRLAVALSVDGLNTIDARHTEARRAMKWVIEPYATVEISGWQVSSARARHFYFTTEADSYGAALGQTQNLGIISAVVFREKVQPIREVEAPRGASPAPSGASRSRPEAKGSSVPTSNLERQECDKKTKDFAATGMGDSLEHRVERVRMELEPTPCQTVNLRYEYRDSLVRLGVLPGADDRLDRRERARGFEPDAWCPEPR
jgi:hypothetical protein